MLFIQRPYYCFISYENITNVLNEQTDISFYLAYILKLCEMNYYENS